MKRFVPFVLSLLLLAGCASGPSGIEVTRFHLSQPLAGASIAVQAADAAVADSLVFRTEADAVLAELVRAGFRPATPAQPALLTAIIKLERSTGQQPRKSGISVGIGGSFGGQRGGIVSGISVPVTQFAQIVTHVVLTLQIRRASDANVVWEGRAATSGTPADAAAGRLARALLTGFPGASGQAVIVRPAP